MEDKLIIVTTESYASAQVLQTYLESNGIKAYLHNENLVQQGYKESDIERAVKILTENHPAKLHRPRKILYISIFLLHRRMQQGLHCI